ncbi:hypothetical protein ABBQ32_004817 [Trebouxia sp. C0010 RCD-2024]
MQFVVPSQDRQTDCNVSSRTTHRSKDKDFYRCVTARLLHLCCPASAVKPISSYNARAVTASLFRHFPVSSVFCDMSV